MSNESNKRFVDQERNKNKKTFACIVFVSDSLFLTIAPIMREILVAVSFLYLSYCSSPYVSITTYNPPEYTNEFKKNLGLHVFVCRILGSTKLNNFFR